MASDCGLHDLRDMGVSARHAITFLYTGSCTLASHDELVPLLHTAKRLDMPVLFDAVAATIGRHLTADSCVGAWTLGVELDAPVLIAAAHALCEKEFKTLAHGDIGSAVARRAWSFWRRRVRPLRRFGTVPGSPDISTAHYVR